MSNKLRIAVAGLCWCGAVVAAMVTATENLTPTTVSLLLTAGFLVTVRHFWKRHPVYLGLLAAPLMLLGLDTLRRFMIALSRVIGT
jgi:hypothetical protein